MSGWVSPSGRRATLGLRSIAACAGLTLACAATASAQEPISGGTQIGGSVPSYLELILTQPTGLATFPTKKTYTTSFQAFVTATDDAGARLSIVDGDTSSAKKLGHLASGTKTLPLPLQARAGTKGAFQLLDQPIDPLLTSWNKPITREPAAIGLRQQVKAKAAGTYHKILLVTVSPETP
jgi:hypothetical protein